MSKLFERDETREERLPSTEALPELPDDVTVPDDARTLTHPGRATIRSASDIRWLRWVALAVVVVGAAVVAGVVLTGDTTETDVPVVSVEWTTPTEGPGSNSMAPDWVPGDGPSWTQPTEGPGSNSLAP